MKAMFTTTRADASYPLPTSKALFAYLCALLFVLAAKGLALVPGYGFDDYSGTYRDQVLSFYLSQGRYTQALLQWLLTQTGLSTTDIAWPTTLACLLLLAAVATRITLRIGTADTRLILIVPCLGIIAAHPYFTEYFTFRQALYNASLYLAFLWLHLGATARLDASRPLLGRDNRWPLLAAIGWLLLAMGGNQITVAIAASAAYAEALADDCQPLSQWRQQIARLLRALAPSIIAMAAYLLLYKGVKSFFSAETDPRGNLLAFADIPTRLGMLATLVGKLVWRDEPTLSFVAKLFFALALLPLFFAAAIRRPRQTILWCVGVVGLMALALAPIALSAVWWPVPRSLSAVGFVMGAMACALVALSGRKAAIYGVPWLATALLMVLSSSAMLHQQLRLNRWDLEKAQGITRDIQIRFGQTPLKHVALGGANYAYPRALTTTDGDLNASAFVHARGLEGLLSEASGDHLIVDEVPDIATNECKGHPRWPQAGSLLETPERIYVCL
jgi:hypothetical protein